VSFNNNANGATVLDANGGRFYFDNQSGCLFSETYPSGPEGFCLTASSTSGFAPYGPTNCSTPATNMQCDAASFDVVATKNPEGPGCIAVLGNHTATTDPPTDQPLAVNQIANGFTIVATKKPGAFPLYWNGVIPLCGGKNPYVGSYTSTIGGSPSVTVYQGTCIPRNACDPRQPTACSPADMVLSGPPLTFTIDSRGIINSDPLQITGTVSNDNSSAAFTQPDQAPVGGNPASCTPSFQITSFTKNGNGKWVARGAESLAGQTVSFSATQN
jgi:hypothetical protein